MFPVISDVTQGDEKGQKNSFKKLIVQGTAKDNMAGPIVLFFNSSLCAPNLL